MSTELIEHRAIVQRIDGDRAIVAMETGGCRSCGHGSSCGIGKLADGRPATLLTLHAPQGICAGDEVRVALPHSRLTLSALLGYLFPAIAMLLGAGIGSALTGQDSAAAFGAICGFTGALVLARIAASLLPGLMPEPTLLPLDSPSRLSPLE